MGLTEPSIGLLLCFLVPLCSAHPPCGTCEVSSVCNTNLTLGCGPDGVWNGSNPKPRIMSYHIHIMFEKGGPLSDPKRAEPGALLLAQSFRSRFRLSGPNCTSLMDEGTWMCEFPYDDDPGTACAMPFNTKVHHEGTVRTLVNPNCFACTCRQHCRATRLCKYWILLCRLPHFLFQPTASRRQ